MHDVDAVLEQVGAVFDERHSCGVGDVAHAPGRAELREVGADEHVQSRQRRRLHRKSEACEQPKRNFDNHWAHTPI